MMPFFRKQITVEYPCLGTLTFDSRNGEWKAEIEFAPTGTSVALSIVGTMVEPDTRAVSAFQRFASSYAILAPQLKEAVWSLWKDWLERWPPNDDVPRTMVDTWEVMKLYVVSVVDPNTIELVYALAGDTWPDGMFTVAVDASGVRALYVDD